LGWRLWNKRRLNYGVYNNTSSFISLYQARREGEGVEGKLTWAPQRLGSLFRR